MSSMKDEIKALLSADRNEAPLSESELAKLKEACDKSGLPVRAFQYTVVAARKFIAEAFGDDDDDAEKGSKKDPDGDKGEKLLDKDKKTEGEKPFNPGLDALAKKKAAEKEKTEGEKPDFLKKNDGDEDDKDKEKKDDEKDEDTTSGNIATVPLPMGNFKKKDTQESIDDAARIARIRARHHLAKMSESHKKPLAVEEIVESLLEDEK